MLQPQASPVCVLMDEQKSPKRSPGAARGEHPCSFLLTLEFSFVQCLNTASVSLSIPPVLSLLPFCDPCKVRWGLQRWCRLKCVLVLDFCFRLFALLPLISAVLSPRHTLVQFFSHFCSHWPDTPTLVCVLGLALQIFPLW